MLYKKHLSIKFELIRFFNKNSEYEYRSFLETFI